MIGRWILDQYIVRAKLGEGGMGAVYLADQPAIGRQAVIKVIHPWLSRDQAIAQRFATEAKAAARLQNPHIVSIYNYGRMPDGTLFLAMEHLAGRTLAQLLRTVSRVDATRAVGIATQVCEALSHAHARGVIHRDLKPSNIMLVARDRGPEFVKVLDFGIAKLDGGDGTTAGAIVGTPQYMSPEALSGRTVDSSSDVYALGLVLYEMLTGRPAFVADTTAAYIHKHNNELPLPLAQACPGLRVPPALEACLMRALAKAPHQRPQSAELFADELWSALMATIDSSHIPTPRVKEPPPRRVAVIVSVLLGVVVVGGIAFATKLVLDHLAAAPPVPTPAPTGAARATAPPAPVVPPVDTPERRLEAERAALARKDVDSLEAELQRATVLSKLPRESIDTAMREYQAAAASPPGGRDATEYRKSLLVDLIVTWRQSRATTVPRDRRVDELEAIFLTMPSSYSVDARRELLLELKTATAGKADADQRVYDRLIEWIAGYGESDDPIEIIHDDKPH
jgi:serine/threonine-protein kinase